MLFSVRVMHRKLLIINNLFIFYSCEHFQENLYSSGETSMLNRKFDYNSLCKCVRNFESLGTGRNAARILVGDHEDARLARFMIAVDIRHNWPSRRQVRFSRNGQVFDIANQTIYGSPVYIFFWNEETEYLWLKQIELERIFHWTETATAEEVLVLAKLIVEEARSSYKVYDHPVLADFAIRAIHVHARRLNLPQLRALADLLEVDRTPQSADAPKVA